MARDPAVIAELDVQRPMATSLLTFIECERAILRYSEEHPGERTEVARMRRELLGFRNTTTVIAISERIAERAGQPFPVHPVRSLDAIHLATVLEYAREVGKVAVLARDHRVRENVEALGFKAVPS